MKVEVELPLTEESLLRGLVNKALEMGLVLVEPERSRPFSVDEAAAELGVSPKTIRNYVEAGSIPRVKGIGRVLIPVRAVREIQNAERSL